MPWFAPTPDSKLNESELQEFAREHLARFQVPERIWIGTKRLPRTASEKIYKRQIREEVLRTLKQQADGSND